jgi:UDP-3-O-[3-hydroxymyristoyl] glucosamine N-acyltransferase
MTSSSLTFGTIVQHLRAHQGQDCPYSGEDTLELLQITDIENAIPGTLSFIDQGGTFFQYISTTQATALILPKNEALQAQATDRNLAWIAVPNPRLAFAQAITQFYQPHRPAPQIHPTAVIDPSATIGERVSLGAHVVIGAQATIGHDVCIHPNVVIYPEVSIGDRTLLHANCTIHERTVIGTDCVIHSGAVIGDEGFGFVPTAQGWYKMEQSGRVVLEDLVDVGSNAAIDRPAVGETRIGRDTKIDNMVHIGHGCQVGKGCAMAAQVGIAGGATIGNYVILAGQVGVANRVKIGDRAIASSKAGVHHDVAPGETVSGYPAIAHRLWLRTSSIQNRLPEIYKVFRRLQKSD